MYSENGPDVAIVRDVSFKDMNDDYGWNIISIEGLAGEDFFRNSLNAMDAVSFIGFPGSKNDLVWFDDEWKLPIARTAHISSYPGRSFSNRSISTADTMLVSGLSFSGSSGSPVFNHPKGLNLKGPLTISGYVESKLIGIMSGHFHEAGDNAFKHSGLSYLTRSTAILQLLDSISK